MSTFEYFYLGVTENDITLCFSNWLIKYRWSQSYIKNKCVNSYTPALCNLENGFSPQPWNIPIHNFRSKTEKFLNNLKFAHIQFLGPFYGKSKGWVRNVTLNLLFFDISTRKSKFSFILHLPNREKFTF